MASAASSSANSSSAPEKPTVAQTKTKEAPAQLDLVFCCDCTSSMSSYIAAAQTSIKQIVEEIVAAEKSDIRFALVQYRDHPPQDQTFAVKASDWTSSVGTMKKYVDSMQAQGGGDGPESVVDALQAALKLDYRDNCARVCVLIADAPPHGLGEGGDGFPDGCPCGLDPIAVAREMAQKDIVIYAVGVEPSLGHYQFARDFMRSIAQITNGQFLALTSASVLAKVIIGGAAEEIALNRIAQDMEAEVQNLRKQQPQLRDTEVIQRVTERLQEQRHVTSQLQVENVYVGDYKMDNVNAMSSASGLSALKGKLKGTLNSHVSVSPAALPTSSYPAPPTAAFAAPSMSRMAHPAMSMAPRRMSAMASPLPPTAASPVYASFAPTPYSSAPAPVSQKVEMNKDVVSSLQVERMYNRMMNKSPAASKPS